MGLDPVSSMIAGQVGSTVFGKVFGAKPEKAQTIAAPKAETGPTASQMAADAEAKKKAALIASNSGGGGASPLAGGGGQADVTRKVLLGL